MSGTAEAKQRTMRILSKLVFQVCLFVLVKKCHAKYDESELGCHIGSLVNGRTAFEEIRPGWTKLSFVCDDGFYLEGPNYLLCHNGTFDNNEPKPRCISNTCSIPLILHGTVSPFLEEYQMGLSIQVRCQPGYTLEEGDGILQCSAEGTWVSLDKKLPRCIESLSANCHTPPPLQDGSLEIEGINSVVHNGMPDRNGDYDATAKATCNPGYRLVPPESRLRHCKDGIWFGIEPKCVPESCEPPASIKHGYYVALSSKFLPSPSESSRGHYAGSSLQFLCDTGYTLQGPSVIHCTNQGTWVPSGVPDCVARKAPLELMYMCPPLDHLLHAQVRTIQGWLSVGGANEGTILELWCQPGYRNRKKTPVTHADIPNDRVCNGPTRLHCTNGSWVGEALDCEPVEGCRGPPYITNGQLEILERISPLSAHTPQAVEIYPIYSTIVYECQRGYWLHGSSMLTCQPDGCWEPRTPDCIPENKLFGWDGYDKDSLSTSLTWVVSLGTACSVCLLLALVWLLVACRARKRSRSQDYGLVRQEICVPGPSHMDTAVQTSQTGMNPRTSRHVERSWPWTNLCRGSTNGDNLSRSPTNSLATSVVSQDPDRLALIAFADGVQVVLPTYEEAVQELCPPPYDVAVSSGTRPTPRRAMLGQPRRHHVVTSTVPSNSQTTERDFSDSLSQHSSVSAPFCPMRHTSGRTSIRSGSVGESLGSLDTVAAASEVSGVTAATVDTFSSGISGGMSSNSNQSRNPSTQGVCGSLASMEGALV